MKKKRRQKFSFATAPREKKTKIREKVGFAVETGVIVLTAKIFYIAGLTVLIPFFPLIFAPDQLLLKAIQTGSIITGVLLVTGSASVIFSHYRTTRSALQALGFFTFIPAIIATLYAIIGPNIERAITMTGPMQEYITHWIQFNTPKAITVSTVYFLLGTALIASSLFWKKE